MSIYSQISGNRWKTISLITCFIAFFTVFFYFVGWYYNEPGTFLVIGLIVSIASSFFSYFFSDAIILATVRAREATREEFFDYVTVTENLAMAAGLPKPRIYVIDDPAPNAFATGRDPKHSIICATTGLLNLMNRGELEAVISHELSHIQNYDILLASIVAVLVGTIALATDWIFRVMWWGGRDDNDRGKNPIVLVLFIVSLVLAPLVAKIIQLAISRKRELQADASGVLITRHPEALARALEKIDQFPQPMQHVSTSVSHLFLTSPLKSDEDDKKRQWLAGLFDTHPPIKERIKILRNM